MPYAKNRRDGTRMYYEDDGGDGPPLVILNGLGDPIAASRDWGVSKALAADYRCIFVDHRGHGLSDKPHKPSAYSTPLRVADVVAVLDDLGIERAHFIGLSWGGRLLFGLGDLAPERVLSLTIGGQTPYAFNPDSRGVKTLTEAFSRGNSMGDFVEALGGFGDMDDTTRARTLDNDFHALAAAWQAALAEGDVAGNLTGWQVPCLIYAGTEDGDFFADAKQAAAEIPGASFAALEGLGHLAAHENVELVLPYIRDFLAKASVGRRVRQ